MLRLYTAAIIRPYVSENVKRKFYSCSHIIIKSMTVTSRACERHIRKTLSQYVKVMLKAIID